MSIMHAHDHECHLSANTILIIKVVLVSSRLTNVRYLELLLKGLKSDLRKVKRIDSEWIKYSINGPTRNSAM
jgi:hypothetical protein